MRPEVLGGIGGFGGLFALDTGRYRNPVIVASTDGCGTKILVARAVGRYDTIGIDLVAMCADDIVCCGAEPLFLLDYVATGKVAPDQMELVVSGIAEGCRQAGCALLGGEMAEHSGVMEPEEFDLAGFCVGVVEREQTLGPDRVSDGDVLVGLASPGLRCNGYTLARHVLLELGRRSLESEAWEGAGLTLAEELLRPSVIYTPAVLSALRSSDTSGAVHAAAHVTGGGIPGNLVRVLPKDLDADVVRGSWEIPTIFREIQSVGGVDDDEMYRVFNMGIGMVLAVDEDGVPAVMDAMLRAGCEATIVGRVVEGSGSVSFSGPGRHERRRDE